MVIKDINKVEGQWYATLSTDDGEISVIIQKGGGRCDWVAYNADNLEQMWEILGVYQKLPHIETWKKGDRITLGCAIKPNHK